VQQVFGDVLGRPTNARGLEESSRFVSGGGSAATVSGRMPSRPAVPANVTSHPLVSSGVTR
jgi:hypothetical protein